MPIKGEILPDHMPLNKFQLLVIGLPPLLFTEIAGIEEELETTDLPDRTKATGGNTLPVEWTAMHPMHHTIEESVLEFWFSEAKDPVSPLYKKDATLLVFSSTGLVIKTYAMPGTFISKRTLPDLDKSNEGEMAAVEWTFNTDQINTLT
jgi:hypothetical protein